MSGATTRDTSLAQVEAVKFSSPTVGWIAADNEHRLLMTTNGGRRWVDVSPRVLRLPGRVLAGGLAGAFFLNQSDFWISVVNLVPDKALPVEVLHTTNGGETWTNAGSFPNDDDNAWVYFVSRSRGLLMVGNGQAANQEAVSVYRTTTAGRRWSELASSGSIAAPTGLRPPGGCDKTGISFFDRSSGWITGSCAAGADLEHSRDGGRTWRAVALFPNLSGAEWGSWTDPPTFFTATRGVIEASLGTARGDPDAIYTTTDGGIRWSEHRPPSPTEGPMDVLSLNTWFIAHSHTLYVSTDAGTSWSTVRSSIRLLGSGSSTDILDFVSPTTGWAITRGKLWHTTDGGRTWKSPSTPR